MADNITVRDANGSPIVMKATDSSGVYTPHHKLDANEEFIGNVGSNGIITPYSELATIIRPATTTTYSINDVLSTDLVVMAASNAAPIEIQTSAAHNLITGCAVTIAGVTGNTAANGSWLITKTAADKFSLNGSAGNGAWVSGGSAAQILVFQNIARLNGGMGMLLGGTILVDEYQAVLPQIRLHLFDTLPSSVQDNLPHAPTDAQMRTLQAVLDFNFSPVAGNNTAGASGNLAHIAMSSQWINTAAGSKDLYGVLTLLNAYIPLAGTRVDVRIRVGARS